MLLRKLGFVVVASVLSVPVWAGGQPGSISGYVRSAAGAPQMGAVVEVLGSAIHSLTLFTDEHGFYSAHGLLPGFYNIRVSAASFLPALRERVGLRAGANVTVNVTLSTLFDSLQWAVPRGQPEEDDWKWVLRSVSNRPVLRIFEGRPPAAESGRNDHELKGTLAFLAGSAVAGYGTPPDMSTDFHVERSLFSSGTMAFSGNLGYADQAHPSAVLRASYSHQLSNGSTPEVALTMRRFSSPDTGLHNADLQALALTTSENLTVGDVLELRFGSELQTIQFMGRVSAFRPFGSATLHLSPNTLVEYRYATSQPDARVEKGFDSAPSDLSESGPHLSLAGFSPALESAHHHEVSLSRRSGKTNLQLALYADRVADPALTGVGQTSTSGGDVLPSLDASSFTYQGKELATHGMRVVLERKLLADLTATLDYDYGGVLDLGRDDTLLEHAREGMTIDNRHALAGKISGTLPKTRTRWIAGYRWISGPALTPVDMFNASPGQTDPYLSFFLRQPIPGTGFLPGHMDALIDVRNLLAQGYIPLLGQDGRTVYLVQSARSVRGGLAFTF
jgi:Carboxypeptidase regulatory-like domain